MRQPAVADRFYPGSPKVLSKSITELFPLPLNAKKSKALAVVAPHAGYVYSGWTAAHAARVSSAGQFSKVVLLGPDHRMGFKSAAI